MDMHQAVQNNTQLKVSSVLLILFVLLIGYFLLLSHFSARGFQEIKINSEEVFGTPLPEATQVITAFKGENLLFGEIAFPNFEFTLRVARAPRIGNQAPEISALFQATSNFRQGQQLSKVDIHPQLIRYVSAQLDTRKARDRRLKKLLLKNGREIPIETFFTRADHGFALALLESDQELAVLIFSGKQRELDLEKLTLAISQLALQDFFKNSQSFQSR